MIVTIRKGNQISIPKQYMKNLNLRVGSKLMFVRESNKLIIVAVDKELDKVFAKTYKRMC